MAAPPDAKVQTGCWIFSEAVMVRDTVSPSLASPVPVVASTMLESVGTVSSCVTALPSVVAVTATPALPPASENPSENVTEPSASSSCATTVQVHMLLAPEYEIVSALVAAVPSNAIAQVGVASKASAPVKVTVIVSPSFDLVFESPLFDRTTAESVGTVSSCVTALLSVVAVTAVPAFPLASVNPMENVTEPSASESCATTVHRWLLPPPGLVMVSVFVASVPSNLMAQVGVAMVSEDVNANEIVFPSMLISLFALFEFRVTDVSVGAVTSAVQENVLDAVLGLVTESVYAPALITTDFAPSEEAVQVAVYVAPEPLNDDSVQPLAVISPTTRSVVVSLEVNVNAIAAVLVVSPLSIVPEEMVIVGLVMSCVAKKLEDVVPETVAVTITEPSDTPLMSA